MEKPSDRELRIIRQQLRHFDIMYRRGEPEITDAEYDAMFQMLQNWERIWPELVTPDSPTQVVEHKDDGTEVHWYDPLP